MKLSKAVGMRFIEAEERGCLQPLSSRPSGNWIFPFTKAIRKARIAAISSVKIRSTIRSMLIFFIQIIPPGLYMPIIAV